MDDPRHLRLPYYALRDPADPAQGPGESRNKSWRPRPSSALSRRYAKRKTRVRNDFFQRFANTRKWTPAGGALNNMGYRVPPGAAAKLEFLRPYKFNLAFENALRAWLHHRKDCGRHAGPRHADLLGQSRHCGGIQSQELSQLL